MTNTSIEVYFSYPRNSYTGSVSYKLRTTDSLKSTVGTLSPLQLNNLVPVTNSNTLFYSIYNLVVDTSMNNGRLITTSRILNVTIYNLLIFYYTFESATTTSNITSVYTNTTYISGASTPTCFYDTSLNTNITYVASGTKSFLINQGGLTTPTIIVPSAGFSISVWFYPTSFNGGGNPRIYQSSYGDGQSIWHSQTTSSSVTLTQSGSLTIATITLNTWYNLVITFDITNSKTTYYLNDVIRSTNTTTAYYTANNTYFFSFGNKNNYFGDRFIGYMDNIAFYSFVLSSTQVSQIYNNRY